jgi:hypothetical protein
MVSAADKEEEGQDVQVLPPNHPNSDDEVLNWVLQKGGYWNPKQYVGLQDPKIGLRGVLAREHISEDEVLVKIPWDAVITPFYERRNDGRDGVSKTTTSPIWDESLGGSTLHPHDRRFANCDMAIRLQEELTTIEESPYAIYVSELQKTAQEHYNLLPAHWSQGGQDLLSTVLGIQKDDETRQVLQALPPIDMFYDEFPWKSTCERLTSKDAVLMVMTHGEEFGMVPVTDKYNSRGGSHEGAYFRHAGSTNTNVALEIRASRDLEPGEPITTTYYGDEPMGMPELLRDYGYIESYPQKFVFQSQNIAFVVTDEDEEDDEDDESNFSSTRKLRVKWLRDLYGRRYMHPKQIRRGTPGQLYKALSYLHGHYNRLVNICPNLSSSVNDQQPHQYGLPSDHEFQTTVRFCYSMLKGLEAALFDLDILPVVVDEDNASSRKDKDLDPSGNEL